MLFAMANSGLPASSFVGEFMVALGAVRVQFLGGLCCGVTLIVSYRLHPLDVQSSVVFGAISVIRIARINRHQ